MSKKAAKTVFLAEGIGYSVPVVKKIKNKQYAFWNTYVFGKKYRKRKLLTDKVYNVHQYVTDLISKIENKLLNSSGVKKQDWFNELINHLNFRKSKLSYNSIRLTDYAIDKVKSFYKSNPVKSPNRQYFYKMQLALLKELKPNTVNLIIQLLLTGLSEIGYAIKLTKIKASGSDSHKPYSTEEQELILNQLKENNPMLYVFCKCIYYTFIRPNELLSLKIKDINFSNNIITVYFGKTGKRYVPINAKIKDVLCDYLNEFVTDKEYYLFGINGCPSEKRMPVHTLRYLYKKNLSEAGLSGTVYAWKHTGIIDCYLKTKDLFFIKKMCGHTSVKTTEVYLRNIGAMQETETLLEW
jgi:integrase